MSDVSKIAEMLYEITSDSVFVYFIRSSIRPHTDISKESSMKDLVMN